MSDLPPARRAPRLALRRRPALVGVALGVLLTVALRLVVVQTFLIPSGSMTHTLEVGDHVVVDKLTWRATGLRRGDVVVFDGTGTFAKAGTTRYYVKRVIGLGGDVVSCCDPAGRVVVDGKTLTEPYVNDPDGVPFGPVLVPAGQLFLLGDHRADSDDSRYLGPVPTAAVVGRAVAVIWPLADLSLLLRHDPSTP